MRTGLIIVCAAFLISLLVAGAAFAYTLHASNAASCANGCCPGPCCIDPSLCPFGCCPCDACGLTSSETAGSCCKAK
jgi:hypothetical protein